MPLNQHIDYTILRPGTREEEVVKLCQEAMTHQFVAACVPPCYLKRAAQELTGSDVAACTVVGFPHGMHLGESKLAEAQALIKQGADELDIVYNAGFFFSQKYKQIQRELAAFATLCRDHEVVSKVIIESALLSLEDIKQICEICVSAQADYVKTSTGFVQGGAELEKVVYMHSILPPEVKIKASGGIRDAQTAQNFIHAGANRIGTSSIILPT